jgi:DNA-binding beta-propeller fold protein YncE
MKLPTLFSSIIAVFFTSATVTNAQTTQRFVYIANSDSADVSGYAIDSNTGALAPVPGSPFPAGLRPVSATVDPSGRFAYVPNLGLTPNANGSISGIQSTLVRDH